MGDGLERAGPRGRHDVDILVVDPDPGPVERVAELLDESDRTDDVHVIDDVAEARAFVRECGDDAGPPPPDLILLDGPPDGAGDEAPLDVLTSDPVLRRIPVLVLTAADDAAAVEQSYERNANAALRKPEGPDEAATLVRAIERFWLTAARLPPSE